MSSLVSGICEVSSQRFNISAFEQEYCREHNIPFPSVSPVERLRQLLIFRNRMHLFRTTCALSGKEIFCEDCFARQLV